MLDDISVSKLIEIIIQAQSYSDIFVDLNNWKEESEIILSEIHPDKCSLSGAKEATEKLLGFINEMENGKEHTDDAGTVTYFPTHILIEGDEYLLKRSIDNYKLLKKEADEHFIKYLPENMVLEYNTLKIGLKNRAIPLISCPKLPQEHLNWILNRLLEFSTWLNKLGYSHNGINPESIYIVPETHGIICISFYHLLRLEEKLSTVSLRYAQYYPEDIYDNKIAECYIDVECSKRTIAFLAGDTSGAAILLKEKLNSEWLDFVLTSTTIPTFEVYQEYIDLLSRNFEKKFYPLHL
jgi:hypothetical protein